MTRISSLTSSVLVASLTILPAAAFAQQSATPAQTAVPASPAVQTPVNAKTVTGMKSPHAKSGTPTHAVPAKTTEPSKS